MQELYLQEMSGQKKDYVMDLREHLQILRTKKSNHPPALPTVATVKFDDTYASPSFCLGLPKYVPIIP